MRHEIVRFDLARGVAALVVFAAHCCQVFLWPLLPTESWLVIISGTAARAAVLAFFVLSGLLITGSIRSNVRRHGYFDPFDYLTSRAARIYPPFIFALSITVGVVAIVKYFDLPGSAGPLGQLRPDGLVFSLSELWHSLLLHGGMTVVNGPLWTLYIEVKLYILAMGAALAINGRSFFHRIAGFPICALACFLVTDLDYGFWFFAAIWMFGASLNVKSRLLIAISGMLTVAFASYIAPLAGNYLDGSALGLGLQAFGCVLFAFVYLLPLSAERRWPKSILETASYSYTLYVVHFPLLVLGYSLSLAVKATSWLGAVVCLAMSATVVFVIVKLAAPMIENDKFFKKALVRKRCFGGT